MKAVQVVAFGRPAEAVRLNEVPDVGSPGPNEVVVAVEAAPINNSDFMIIAGRYGYLPTPPATLGIEGVGRVIAAGAQADLPIRLLSKVSQDGASDVLTTLTDLASGKVDVSVLPTPLIAVVGAVVAPPRHAGLMGRIAAFA